MYFFFVLVDRQKQEVVTQNAKRWDRKKEDPAHQLPTITNQSPLPKVKTAMQAPPMWESDDGIGDRIQTKVSCSPLHPEQSNQKFVDINTS